MEMRGAERQLGGGARREAASQQRDEGRRAGGDCGSQRLRGEEAPSTAARPMGRQLALPGLRRIAQALAQDASCAGRAADASRRQRAHVPGGIAGSDHVAAPWSRHGAAGRNEPAARLRHAPNVSALAGAKPCEEAIERGIRAPAPPGLAEHAALPRAMDTPHGPCGVTGRQLAIEQEQASLWPQPMSGRELDVALDTDEQAPWRGDAGAPRDPRARAVTRHDPARIDDLASHPQAGKPGLVASQLGGASEAQIRPCDCCALRECREERGRVRRREARSGATEGDGAALSSAGAEHVEPLAEHGRRRAQGVHGFACQKPRRVHAAAGMALALEHHDSQPAPGRSLGACEPGEARAHDRDVVPGTHRRDSGGSKRVQHAGPPRRPIRLMEGMTENVLCITKYFAMLGEFPRALARSHEACNPRGMQRLLLALLLLANCLPVAASGNLSARFAPPPGFERIALPEGSFGAFLREHPLRAGRGRVMLHDGSAKARQDVHLAVLDLDIGRKDLQQCADTIIRLRAEWLWSRGEHEALAFRFTSGDLCKWTDWARGQRPRVRGNEVSFVASAAPDASRESFRRWLDTVFTYAGTISLHRELTSVKATDRIEAGDVFIQAGSPGHAMLVVDVVVHPATRERRFLLVQGFMPAQDAHVVVHPETGGPWYREGFGELLETPEWTFRADERRRFAVGGRFGIGGS